MSIFTTDKIDFLQQPMFFGDDPNIARYDVQRYSVFEKLTTQQLSFFWRPEELDVSKDNRDFKQLSEVEKSIFINNLKYQTLLDSVQGRAISIALIPYISIPELEVCSTAWAFFETIHSRSYTHIIRNLFANPGDVFDTILDDPMIIERAKSVTSHYDDFIEYASLYKQHGFGTHQIQANVYIAGIHQEQPNTYIDITEYELKKKLYLMLIAINILEGIRFYVSFACSFAFAELDKMEANAKMISLIARDENVHLAITQNILKLLPKDDVIYNQIIERCEPLVYEMYDDAVEQEKNWAKYLFKDGSMIGLNAELLSDYVEHIANKRMRTIGLKSPYSQTSNPLSWTTKYLSSKSQQSAPQETENSSYLVGSIDNNMSETAFTDFVL